MSLPKPYFEDDAVTIYHGDCRDILPTLPPVDLILTDPPYGLSFMGKEWDHGVPGVEFWEAALAAAKPGAHLLAFGGTRTFHRLAVAIEDAGWEIRDTMMWVYGSGFPKSLDVGKAIDKAAGAEREVVGRVKGRGSNSGEGRYNWNNPDDIVDRTHYDATRPATEAARQWDGWGTALKPAWEPIIVARKPLEGTVAENVLKYGTGALNIDASRVGENPGYKYPNGPQGNTFSVGQAPDGARLTPVESTKGRWPANLLHDGSDEVVGLFPQMGKAGVAVLRNGKSASSIWGSGNTEPNQDMGYGDSGSAARFFYTAKASKADRTRWTDANNHPTVKPSDLMKYLCRLASPPGSIVLDPFMGSGTTLRAAADLGRKAIGIEIEEKYCEIAAKRMSQGVLM